MELAIRLSCILALFFCLASTENAAPSDQDRQKLQELLRRNEQNAGPDAQVRITYETVEMYKKYRGLEKSNAIEDVLNTKVKEFESKIELVEGVPKQGAGFGAFFTNIFKGIAQSSEAQKIAVDIGAYLAKRYFGL